MTHNPLRPLFIFDLDGTLADVEHRRHHVSGEQKDWAAFYRNCVYDPPIKPVVNTLLCLSRSLQADCWVWSGRSDEVKSETKDWLWQHVGIPSVINSLRMRPENDYTPDDVLKRQWYDSLSENDQRRLVAIFDDRDKVVAMWRELGLTCYQVAPGAF